jgi:hypothetical protein
VINGIPKYILDEIIASAEVVKMAGFWNAEEMEWYITEYLVKNVFTTLYKYVCGIYKLYHFDSHFNELHVIHKRFLHALHKYTYKSMCDLHERHPGVKNVKIIMDFLKALKVKVDEFSKVVQLFPIEGEQFEEEEINRPKYYKLKRYCVILLSSMDNLYISLGKPHLLIKYRRVSYQEYQKKLWDEEGFTSADVEAKFGINLLNHELRAKLIQEDSTVPEC